MSAADDRLPLQQHTASSGPGHTDKSPVVRPCFLAQLPVPAVSPVAVVAHPSGGGDATAAQKHTTVSFFGLGLHQWCQSTPKHVPSTILLKWIASNMTADVNSAFVAEGQSCICS